MNNPMAEKTDLSWQQKALETILLENLKEQKRKRRWSTFFRLVYLLIFITIIILISQSNTYPTGNVNKPHIALINIDGEISDANDASASNIITGVDKAFKDTKTVGVILNINSPGGSPVQSSDVYNEILRQRILHPKIKVYAVCNDVCASGAYYIAAAANDIYANPSSIVGSIGVLLDGFGFVDTIQKLGIERRLITSGNEKGFLDPFSPISSQDRNYAQNMLNIVHTQFINAVKNGRGKRLKISSELFSGLPWTGQQGLAMGLIDGFGDSHYVARNVIKNNNLVDYTKKSGVFNQLGKGIGSSFYHSFAEQFGLMGARIS